MRARIYSACRELSWLAPVQAKRAAVLLTRAVIASNRVESAVGRAIGRAFDAATDEAFALRAALLEHVRER